MLDYLLTNAIVYDGLGNPGCRQNLGIRGTQIAYLGPDRPAASETVDLDGLALAPGFIDIHSHSDSSFMMDTRCESKIYQGVTSELTGQCGSSIYPYEESQRDEFKDFVGSTPLFDLSAYASQSLADFMDTLRAENLKPTVNQLPLIGHGALRVGVIGNEGRKATADEVKRLCQRLDVEMQAGAWGLSLGLGYAPGIFADLDELIPLGRIVKNYGGLITSHMRNQGAQIIPALDEMFAISEDSGVKMHIAHLKASGRKEWGRAAEILDYIAKAKKSGLPVSGDVYPYSWSSSGLTNIFPKWSLAGGVAAAAERLRQGGEEKERILAHLRENYSTLQEAEAIQIVSTNGHDPAADGLSIRQLAEKRGMDPVDCIADLCMRTNGHCNTNVHAMSDEDVMTFLKDSTVSIGSDGSSYPFDPERNNGILHPRNFGTFPLFLKLVREQQICSWETAIHRMTALSAARIGLTDRGQIQEGFIADLCAFDPLTVRDRADYQNPFQQADGIPYVFVSGRKIIADGRMQEANSGQVLLKR